MDLILKYNWGGEPCSGTDIICFEYKSVDDFVFDMLEKYKNHPFEFYGKSNYDTDKIQLFRDVFLSKGEIEDLERCVFTLEDWFKNNKQKIK